MIGAREAAVWLLGLCCGVGITAAGDNGMLPCGLAIALAGAVPIVAVGLRHLLRPRQRAVVWEEAGWRFPGEGATPARTPAGAAGPLG